MKEETMEIKKVYKILLEEDGELKSTIAGRGLGDDYLAQDKPRLTYKEGTITYTPEGTVGLFFEKTLDKAREYVEDVPHDKGTVRIHEATPLGSRKYLMYYGGICPALLLGKEVWREEAPKEEWVDVTSECGVEEYKRSNSLVGELKHGNKTLAWLSYDGLVPSSSCPDGYKFEPVREWHIEGKKYHWIRVFHKQAI